jgi:hypothetical protein
MAPTLTTSHLRGKRHKKGAVHPVESTYEYKTRGEESWHCRPHGAIARCGPRQAWHAVAGTETGLGVNAAGYTRALTRFFSLLQEGRLMRKRVQSVLLETIH